MATRREYDDHPAAGGALGSVPPLGDADRAAHELLVKQLLAHDQVAGELGITVSATMPGRAVATMAADDRMINGHGVVHGGYIFLLADSAFAMACVTARGPTNRELWAGED